MKTLSERQEGLLDTVIAEYIKLAQPIASQYLEERYDFGVSPATIRNELQTLSEEGYLEQPHTSAGRVPTDKGYRFFVDGISKPAQSPRGIEAGPPQSSKAGLGGKWEEVFEKEVTDALAFTTLIVRALADATSGLAALYMESAPLVFKEGWEDILLEPEFEEPASIKSFTKFLNDFEKSARTMQFADDVAVFIGKENPFSRITDFSIMIAECSFGERGKGKVALLGPKRMEYPRNIHLLNEFSKIWRNR